MQKWDILNHDCYFWIKYEKQIETMYTKSETIVFHTKLRRFALLAAALCTVVDKDNERSVQYFCYITMELILYSYLLTHHHNFSWAKLEFIFES